MTHLWLSLPFEASETAVGQIADFARSRTAGPGGSQERGGAPPSA